MKFTLQNTDKYSNARAGEFTTAHGSVQTPIFMPVGTVGSVKGCHIRDIHDDVNAQIILGNTYHLYLRPGTDILLQAGGLHKFNGWDRPILTDSGGFQVFSLAAQRKIKEEGVMFRSHIDGSKHLFSPENVMNIQRIIGGDIMMAFDECPPYPCDYNYASKSLDITLKWLKRCFDTYHQTECPYGYHQSLFPIVQGSVFKDLRERSTEAVMEYNADGNAIGGVSVGEPIDLMYEATAITCNILPKDKPRYLMGVGTPANILESIAMGVDMMDCVMPSRNGRNGMLFTSEGIINIKNEKWKADFSQIDPNGISFVDSQYSKAYLRHLFTAGEMLAPMIATMHNLAFYLWLVKTAREKIIDGTFTDWKNKMVVKLASRL